MPLPAGKEQSPLPLSRLSRLGGAWGPATLSLSLSLAAISLVWHSRENYLLPTPISAAATLCWLLSVVGILLYGILSDRRREPTRPPEPALTPLERTVVGFACLGGLLLRISRLRVQPLYLDEYYWLAAARRILHGQLLTPFGFIGDQPSNLQAWGIAPLLALLRDPVLAVRVPGLLYSFGTLYFVFRALREFSSRESAVAAVVLISFSAWDIHQGQLGYENVAVMAFLISGTLLFLLRSVATRKPFDLIACGVLAGMAFNTLYVEAVVVAVVAVVWLKELGWVPRKAGIKATAPLLVAFLVTTAPTVPKVLRFEKALAQTQTFLTQSPSGEHREAAYYWKQTVLLMRDYGLDEEKLEEWEPWGVTLDRVSLAAFLVGLVYCLVHFKKPVFFALLAGQVFFSLVMILLYRYSSVWREYGLFVFIYGMAAIGVGWALQIARRTKFSGAVLVGVALLIASSGLPILRYEAKIQSQRVPSLYETVCARVSRDLTPLVQGRRILLRKGTVAASLIAIQLPDGTDTRLFKQLSDLEDLRRGTRHIVVEVFREPDHPDAEGLEGLMEFLRRSNPPYREVAVRDGLGTRAVLFVSPDP